MRGTAFVGSLLIAAIGLVRARPTAPLATATPEPEPPASAIAPAAAEASALEEPAAEISPAMRYVSLSSEACLAELDARHIAYARVDRPEVESPVRIVGPLSGVRFRTLLSMKERERSPYEIFDCRLVLALDDFAKILRRHDIVDVMHYSAFRPLVPGVTKRGHERALAIDVAFLGRANGSAYSVLRDFTPMPNEHPCRPVIRAAGPREMRAIACEAAAQGIFHVALTPDYDDAHRDHYHLELVPGETRSFAR